MKKKILSALLALSLLSAPAFIDTSADLPYSINAEAVEKLAKPTSVKATVKDGKITLSWKKVSGAEAYAVYKYNAGTKKYEKVKTVTKTKVTISAEDEGTYKFRIYSMDKVNGKYKKGNYASKSVKVSGSSSSKVTLPEISDFNKGMEFGLSLKQVQKAHGFKDYTEIYNQYDSLYILVKNDGGSYNSYAFYGDKLIKWGFALKDSESNFKKMCRHFEDKGWEEMPGSDDDHKIYTKDVYMVLVYRDDIMGYVFANITDMGNWSSAE